MDYYTKLLKKIFFLFLVKYIAFYFFFKNKSSLDININNFFSQLFLSLGLLIYDPLCKMFIMGKT